ncbi:hypothetical protein [Rhodococcus tibetensis]|uniref:Uncharacterized protein n=1 Tax=Rhodococcus tibetensis TaxID=2965064 RepID=A0ABT1QF89_9NOCA|nr:hypothetical protein [Rhodococcus sp. FXJ9.536]MCQ4120954.1 hypothetical protein [Rhodococcus sp. FXJ9.536]
MTTVSHIEVARARRSRLVLFIGNPTSYYEVTRWAKLRQWMAAHGLEPVRELDGDILCAIVTDDVLDGVGSPKDEATTQRARETGVPCVSLHDTSRILGLTARARTRSMPTAGGVSAHTRHEGA